MVTKAAPLARLFTVTACSPADSANCRTIAIIYVQVMRQGRRTGAPGSPSAFETDFGCVLAGEAGICASTSPSHLIILHLSLLEIGSCSVSGRLKSLQATPPTFPQKSEWLYMQHFQQSHRHLSTTLYWLDPRYTLLSLTSYSAFVCIALLSQLMSAACTEPYTPG